MDEVKKVKKQQKKKNIGAKPKKIKAVAEPEVLEEPEKPEEPKGDEEVEGAEEVEEVKAKKSKKGWIVAVILIILLAGGGFAAKMFFTKTTVATETVKLSDDARGASNYFKTYLLYRAKAEQLFKYTYKDLTDEGILKKLTELKDGFSKVSGGVSGNYKTGEYKELAEVMEIDASIYLTAVRELRSVLTDGGMNNDEKRAAFAQKVEENTKNLRSALYVSKVAFDGDVSGFSSKGVLIFDGPVVVEVGGGVMNILLGDFDEKLVAVSTEQLGEEIKLIDAAKLYGYVSTRLVNVGMSLDDEIESGWVKHIDADVSRAEAKLTKTRISTVMKNVWGMDEELRTQGIKGLVGTEEKSAEDELSEVVKGLTGR